jgi:hypothetical protein
MDNGPTLRSSYFRKFFVPIVLTALLFAAVYVMLTTPPNIAAPWNTFNTVFGGAEAGVGMLGGALRRAARRLK